jgi:nicotinamidase-related amidase
MNNNKALLIIDVQNDYFKGGKAELVGPEAAARNVKRILDRFRKDNLPVVHIQHLSVRSDASFFLPGTSGAEINQTVRPLDEEKVIVKHYPNSFRETDLLNYLTSMEVRELVIVGMMTHMCVDATTRAAKDFGFNCVVVGDACATKDLAVDGENVKAHQVQKAFLAALNYFYADVTTSDRYLSETL